MLGIGKNLGRRSTFDNAPILQDHDFLAEVCRDAKIVRDEKHGEAQAAAQVVQKVEDLFLDGDVERRDRLVCNKDVGFHSQGTGDADALAEIEETPESSGLSIELGELQ